MSRPAMCKCKKKVIPCHFRYSVIWTHLKKNTSREHQVFFAILRRFFGIWTFSFFFIAILRFYAFLMQRLMFPPQRCQLYPMTSFGSRSNRKTSQKTSSPGLPPGGWNGSSALPQLTLSGRANNLSNSHLLTWVSNNPKLSKISHHSGIFPGIKFK